MRADLTIAISTLKYAHVLPPSNGLCGKTVVVNMSPADIKKEGAAYDLPIAIGTLASDEVVKPDLLSRYMIMGELSLDGSLKPVRGAPKFGNC